MSDIEPVTLARVVQETRSLFGHEIGDLDYISDELVATDSRRTDPPEVGGGETLGEVCYGTNPRWGRVRIDGITHSVILFDCSADPSDPQRACDPTQTGWLYPNAWMRHLLGSCRGDVRRPQYRFNRKRTS
jgi:hypothetical protein